MFQLNKRLSKWSQIFLIQMVYKILIFLTIFLQSVDVILADVSVTETDI